MISPQPDIRTLEIDPEKDSWMILACDGIWNFMSSQEVVDYIQQKIGSTPSDKLSSICEEVSLSLRNCYKVLASLLILSTVSAVRALPRPGHDGRRHGLRQHDGRHRQVQAGLQVKQGSGRPLPREWRDSSGS